MEHPDVRKLANHNEPSRPVSQGRMLGLSHDQRTHRWRLVCAFPDCGHEWEPPTTMFRSQSLTCPRCGGNQSVDYNLLTP